MSRPATSETTPNRQRRSGRALAQGMFALGIYVIWRFGPWLLLATALLVGAWFRFTGLDWDSSTHLHPDERHITITTAQVQWPDSPLQYFDTETSPLNPYNQGVGSFVYGTLPMFVTKAAAGIVDKDAYDGIHLVGRFLTASLDVLIILLVFLIARRLSGRWGGALAAALYACAVQAIQQAHFYTMDTWVTFFATLALWLALRWQEEGRWYNLVGVSVIAGMALASKLGVATLALPIGVAFLLRAWRETQPPTLALTGRLLARLGGHLLVGGVLVYASLRLFLPYIFASASPWDPRLNPRYTQDIETLRYLAGGEADFPPSFSWATTNYPLFPHRTDVSLGDGVGASNSCVAGAALGHLARIAAQKPCLRACCGVGACAFRIPSGPIRQARSLLPANLSGFCRPWRRVSVLVRLPTIPE